MKLEHILHAINRAEAVHGKQPDMIFLTKQDHESIAKELRLGDGHIVEKLWGINIHTPFKFSGTASIEPIIQSGTEPERGSNGR